MRLTVEAQGVELKGSWKSQLQERLEALSDARDPLISARSTITFSPSEVPPAAVALNISVRGRNIVISKKADHVEAALKAALDTAKRELRQFYDQRSSHRVRPAGHPETLAEAAVPPTPFEED